MMQNLTSVSGDLMLFLITLYRLSIFHNTIFYTNIFFVSLPSVQMKNSCTNAYIKWAVVGLSHSIIFLRFILVILKLKVIKQFRKKTSWLFPRVCFRQSLFRNEGLSWVRYEICTAFYMSFCYTLLDKKRLAGRHFAIYSFNKRKTQTDCDDRKRRGQAVLTTANGKHIIVSKEKL